MAEIVTKARDTMAKLKNPRTRFQVINKLDTEEINRLKARYAYIKRKEFLFELISRFDIKNLASDHEERRSNWSASPSSELNFPTTEDKNRHHGNDQEPEDEDHIQEEVDMGDYENRIRPSPNYWYTLDGRNLAEKIIYYRTYRLQSTTELESTLIDYKRPLSPLKSNDPPHLTQTPPQPFAPLPQPLPVVATQAAVVATAAMVQPGSKSASHNRTLSKEVSPRPKTGPSIFSGRSPNKAVFNNGIFDDSELNPENKKDDSAKIEKIEKVEKSEKEVAKEEQIVKEKVTKNKKTKKRKQKNEQKTEEKNEETIETKLIEGEKETSFNESETVKQRKKETVEETETDTTDNKQTKNRTKITRDSLEKDALISKLDKRIERDLKALQGIHEDGDDDDDGLDDDTFNDVIQGNINKEIDEFLKIH